MVSTPALSIQNLCKQYTNNSMPALNDVSFSVDPGDFFALLGPNGAGKSTLISILVDLVKKDAGKVCIFGHDIDKNFSAAKRQIGIMPQEFNLSVFELPLQILIQQAGYYGVSRRIAKKRAMDLLAALDLDKVATRQIRMLSGGMKRRLMIARALIHEPRLLILDEPTAGVDVELRRNIWDFLRELNRNGTSIILTTHYLEEAEILCKNIAILRQGKLIQHTDTQSLLQQLHTETFILTLSKAISENITLPNLPFRHIDPLNIAIDITKDQTMNSVFSDLSAAGIEILSVRTQTNRLEELFLRLTQ